MMRKIASILALCSLPLVGCSGGGDAGDAPPKAAVEGGNSQPIGDLGAPANVGGKAAGTSETSSSPD